MRAIDNYKFIYVIKLILVNQIKENFNVNHLDKVIIIFLDLTSINKIKIINAISVKYLDFTL